MLRKICILGTVCLLAVTMLDQSRAAIIFSLDLDPSDGVQDVVTRSVGSTVTAELLMSGSGVGDSVSLYQVSLRYDPTKLSLNSFTEITPTGWVESDTQLKGIPQQPGDGNAYLLRIGSDIGGGPVAPFSPIRVASVTFDVLDNNNAQIAVGLFEQSPLFAFDSDALLDNGFGDASSVFVGSAGIVNSAAVPEPSSLGLLIGAGVCLRTSRRAIRKYRKMLYAFDAT